MRLSWCWQRGGDLKIYASNCCRPKSDRDNVAHTRLITRWREYRICTNKLRYICESIFTNRLKVSTRLGYYSWLYSCIQVNSFAKSNRKMNYLLYGSISRRIRLCSLYVHYNLLMYLPSSLALPDRYFFFLWGRDPQKEKIAVWPSKTTYPGGLLSRVIKEETKWTTAKNI